MKKIFILILILIIIIIYIPQKTYPVFDEENNSIEEFSNDEKCLNAVRRISAAFAEINTASVLSKKASVLCGITTDNNSAVSEADINKVLSEIFFERNNIKIEINTKRAEDIMELSYLSLSNMKEKYISLRYDFLISED